MPRFDRKFVAGKERVSQTDIHRATARDHVGKTEPQDTKADMNWESNKRPSGPLSAPLGDILQAKTG